MDPWESDPERLFISFNMATLTLPHSCVQVEGLCGLGGEQNEHRLGGG